MRTMEALAFKIPVLTQQQHPFMSVRWGEGEREKREKEVVCLSGKKEEDVAAPPTPSSISLPSFSFKN